MALTQLQIYIETIITPQVVSSFLPIISSVLQVLAFNLNFNGDISFTSFALRKI